MAGRARQGRGDAPAVLRIAGGAPSFRRARGIFTLSAARGLDRNELPVGLGRRCCGNLSIGQPSNRSNFLPLPTGARIDLARSFPFSSDAESATMRVRWGSSGECRLKAGVQRGRERGGAVVNTRV